MNKGYYPLVVAKEVKEAVKRAIFDLAPGGGYILAPAHDVQPDTPIENVLALYEAVKEYGNYSFSI
jgi:uroporphyrinogen decarboxylase